MKSTIVRLSVLALAFAGFTASTITASKPVVKPVVVAAAGGSAPLCWPGHGVCGLD